MLADLQTLLKHCCVSSQVQIVPSRLSCRTPGADHSVFVVMRMRSEKQIPEKCFNGLNTYVAEMKIFTRRAGQSDSLDPPCGVENSVLSGDVGATQGHRGSVEEVLFRVKAGGGARNPS
jgi:hypothetical protein